MKGMELLGLKVQDKVTGIKGIATSISYDLYGCVQVIITAGAKDNSLQKDNYWYDSHRLKILSKKPVMELPDFEELEEKPKGPAMKPSKF